MEDIYFDISARDLVIQNGDFETTINSSTQNGAILKESRCFSPLTPVWGIGLGEIIEEPIERIIYEMNRWVKQARDDGAEVAKFGPVTNNNRITDIPITIGYNG